MLKDLIHFTNEFKHVEKAFLEAKTADEAIKVLIENKFALTWFINNKIVEYFETKPKTTKTEDKDKL